MVEYEGKDKDRRRTYAFIGLGSLGIHLAFRLLLEGFTLYVYDLDECRFSILRSLLEERGLGVSNLHCSPSVCEAVLHSDCLITCLPNPKSSKGVIEQALPSMHPNSLWIEMSTNDPQELRELACFAEDRGISTLAVPVTGGVHRAAAGEITLLIGGDKRHWRAHARAFSSIGGKQIYVGSIEQAAELKAITNMLAFIHLSATGEAFALAQASGVDLRTAYEVIAHSSGSSFVFETEGQVILNGSYHIDFTMDLALKDLGFVCRQARRHGIPLALANVVERQFTRAKAKYGGTAQSPKVVKLLEEELERDFRARGFPSVLPPG